jgi:DNA processing protein
VVVPGDEEWPGGLDDLAVPPWCLWVRGPAHLARSVRRSVSVVGARAATAYGEHVAAELGAGLAQRGWTVVSGAAFGIDAAAHRGVLAMDGLTVACLAGGVERAYPAAHAALIERVLEAGAVLSEVPPGAAPMRSRFLARNRVIAALTAGTVVVEAGLRSGSLSTARHAVELGRHVAVVPGPVTSAVSAGCHEAVRSGLAVLVTSAEEVVELVGDLGADACAEPRGEERPGDDLDEREARVLDALPASRPVDLDGVAVLAALDPRSVRAALARLEEAGLVDGADGRWRKVPADRPGHR